MLEPVLLMFTLLDAASAAQASATGTRTYANARVVAVDAQARTITVRMAGAATDETFSVEAGTLQRVGALKRGDRVVLTLRKDVGVPTVVTHIRRSVASAASPAPRPKPSRPPTDTVGPLQDPRKAPVTDPRKNPLRDPRVVPGLSEPVPTPSPTASPS